MRRIATSLVAALVCAVAAVTLTAGPAHADTTITVNTTDDSTAPNLLTSLREAFAMAWSDDVPTTINLQAGATYVLDDCSASGGQLWYQDPDALTLNGNGATIQQTCPGERVMSVATSGAPVIVTDLTITGGNGALSGAGLYANAPLTLQHVRFQGNTATGTDHDGGGLRSQQTTVITDSVFTGNRGYRGGGLNVTGTLTMTRTAVVDNEGAFVGGAYVTGSASVANSTIADNTAMSHVTGGIFTSDNLTLHHATIARNRGTGGTASQLYAIGNLTANRSAITDPGAATRNCSVGGTTFSQGYNVSSDVSCALNGTGDQVQAGSSGVAAAADNGGGTLTALPAAASPMVDHIPAAACDLPTDQRGVARPQGAGCDAGAAELTVAPPPVCDGQVVTVDLSKGQSPTTGADVILGTPGNDTVNGLAGNDRFCGLGGADTFTGGPGNDRAFGGKGADTLKGNGGADVLDGGRGNDRAFGGAGADVLRGVAGQDRLEGGAGNDAHLGGPQRDTCRGGAGTDTRASCELRVGFP